MITIDRLTKRYRKHEVLSDFSMAVSRGESVALWGPNGAGKTTVIRCILGLVAFDGAVSVDGLDVRSHGKAVRAQIGYVPQELAFYDEMPLVELLDYSARLRGLGAERVDAVVEMLGLGIHAAKRVRELSGGLKQRAGLAAALLPDPPILLLDEPTANLDAGARESAIRVFDDLRHLGRTLIITSHHMEEVGMLVDRVVAMEEGRKVTECPPSDLAETLGLRAWLHLLVRDEATDRALRVLTSNGFDARANSHGVIVEVSAQSKGKAIEALQSAGIRIDDLEVWR